jgi:hypothetical protein
MRTTELIKEIQRLPVQKRMFVIEKTIHSIRQQDENSELKKAAELLCSDYNTDTELTAFSSLEFEDFYEAR